MSPGLVARNGTDGYCKWQLIVTIHSDTVTAMANSSEREDFSKRLRESLAKHGGNIESPTRLAEEFSVRYSGKAVTQQAVRKWLNGEAYPSQDKIKILAAWLNVGSEWLRFGKDDGQAPRSQQTYALYRLALSDQELLKCYHALNNVHQQAVSEIISALTHKRKR